MAASQSKKIKKLKGPRFRTFLPTISLGEFFFTYAEKHKSNVCQIDATTDEVDTYSHFKLKTIRVALCLDKRGLAPTDVVVICSQNNINTCIPIVACLYLGIKVAKVDPTLPVDSLKYALRTLNPAILFTGENNQNLINECLRDIPNKVKVVVFGRTRSYDIFANWLKPVKNEELFTPRKSGIYEAALIVSTSGTVQLPKLMYHSNYSFLQSVQMIYNSGVRGERILHLSSSWLSSLMILACAFIDGGVRIFSSDTEYNGKKIMNLVEKYQPEAIVFIPNHAYILTTVIYPKSYNIASLKRIIITGSTINREKMGMLMQRFKDVTFICNYGMCEVGLVSSFNSSTDVAKIGSCGRVVPGVKVKVLNFETEQPVASTERGEFRIKSPALMVNYLEMDCAQYFDRDRFFKTEDIGYYDEAEYVYVEHKLHEIFKVKGRNIVPASIEMVLLQHPAIKEAVVYGNFVGNEGMLPSAAIVLMENQTLTEKELHKFVEEKVAADEQLKGGVTFLPRLPTSRDGKVLRNEVMKAVMEKKENMEKIEKNKAVSTNPIKQKKVVRVVSNSKVAK